MQEKDVDHTYRTYFFFQFMQFHSISPSKWMLLPLLIFFFLTINEIASFPAKTGSKIFILNFIIAK